MSARPSGNPGPVRLASRVALVLGLLAAIAGPLAPLTAAAGGVTVTTPFPAIVAEPGSTASFALAIDVSSARQVSLGAEDVPSGWTARFRGGGLVIDGAYVTPGDDPEITLDLEIPEDTPAGSTNLRVVAAGGGGEDTLRLTIRVADAAAGSVTLTSDFPELQAAAGSEFTFNVTLQNDTAADTTFTMNATGPEGWTVEAKPQSQEQATTLTVNAGATGTITVTATPSPDGAGSCSRVPGVSGFRASPLTSRPRSCRRSRRRGASCSWRIPSTRRTSPSGSGSGSPSSGSSGR